MTTVKDVGTIITARDLLLLRTLVLARVLNGEQVKTIGGFPSVRRTNRRLLKLVRAGLLKRWFVGTASGGQKALYGLSPRGANLIGETTRGLIPWKQDALITNSQFIAHQQAVNAVFIRARFHPLPVGFTCERWMSFREVLSPSVPLVPDAYFEIVQQGSIQPMFLEVDLGTESSRVWKRKVELYLKLALGGEFERTFQGKRFRVLVVLHSQRRLEAIRRTVAKRTEKLFWFSTEDELAAHGLSSPIWLRPAGTQRIPLL
jgi:Replication-relaxation